MTGARSVQIQLYRRANAVQSLGFVRAHGNPRNCWRWNSGSFSASLNSPNNPHFGRSFQRALSILQYFTQCKVLFPGTCSSSEMHQHGPPVHVWKCIRRCHTERSALCCQQVGKSIQELWRDFFSDPSQWWDHRLEKVNPRFPDFKHKKTHAGLWLIDKWNPPWVCAELAAMAPGIVQVNIFAWNRKLVKLVKAHEYERTIELFQQLQQEGMNPDKFTFIPVLNACSNLRALAVGRGIHAQIMESGCESDIFVSNCLVDMYSKCGKVEDAQRVFNKMPTRDVVSWNTLILGYVKFGEGQKALELFPQMQLEGVEPSPITFLGLVNACANIGAIQEGRRVHGHIIQSGCECNVYLGNSLIDMYAKCGSIDDAIDVFNKMPTRDVVSWNAMILGHVKCGQGQKALDLFTEMKGDGVDPDPVSFVGLLSACTSVGKLEVGTCVHQQIIQRGYESDVYVSNSLINMYAACGSIEGAWTVFNKMPRHTVVSWNAMILGYAQCGAGEKALRLSHRMHAEGVEPNLVTFLGLLNACASIMNLKEGRNIHQQIIEGGCESVIIVGNSLIDMYAKCGSIEDARNVFNKMTTHDVVSWSAIILGYVKCGQGKLALELSEKMYAAGVEPDPITFVGLLNACSSVGALDKGRHFHQEIIQLGYESDVFVSNCLLDMYAKCGSIDDAWRVFSRMPKQDVVTWSSMILGFVKCGQGQKALDLSWQMQEEGVDPNPVTFVAMLNACASIAALEEGRCVHEQITKSGCESNVFVQNGLVDMYAKCGSIADAEKVFKEMPTHDVATWNAMLAGYAMHGHTIEALGHFEWMCQEDIESDGISFLSLLSACSHGGLVDEGCHYFETMRSACSISPAVDHHACMVDLLGRAGQLHEAEDLTKKMPCVANASVWMPLLAACRVHGNVEMGELAAKQVLELDPDNSAGYVLLSNIYAATDM